LFIVDQYLQTSIANGIEIKIEDLLSSPECILKFKKWKENILTPINSPGKMYISPKKAVT